MKTKCMQMVFSIRKVIHCSVNTSPVFEEFLNFIGQRIELKGHQGYTGGLDVKSTGSTGKYSIISEVDGYSIMFHVCAHLL